MIQLILIKGIKINGVSWGVKWEKKSFKKKENNIIEIHKDRESDKQNLKCLEAVKI